MLVGSIPFYTYLTSDIAPVLSKEFLDIQATMECEVTLKRLDDLLGTYSHKMRYLIYDRIYIKGSIGSNKKKSNTCN